MKLSTEICPIYKQSPHFIQKCRRHTEYRPFPQCEQLTRNEAISCNTKIPETQ